MMCPPKICGINKYARKTEPNKLLYLIVIVTKRIGTCSANSFTSYRSSLYVKHLYKDQMVNSFDFLQPEKSKFI